MTKRLLIPKPVTSVRIRPALKAEVESIEPKMNFSDHVELALESYAAKQRRKNTVNGK